MVHVYHAVIILDQIRSRFVWRPVLSILNRENILFLFLMYMAIAGIPLILILTGQKSFQ